MTAQAPIRPALLFVAGWWPSPKDQVSGTFIREHALAASALRPVAVIHLVVDKGSCYNMRIELEHDGPLLVARVHVRTPLRRFGVHDLLVRRAYRRALNSLESKYRFEAAHIHVLLPSTAPMIDVARERGWPVLITEHSSFYHRGATLMAAGLYAARKREAIRRLRDPIVARVLPVSGDLAHRLVTEFGADPAKVHVVPNAANPCFQRGMPEAGPMVRLVLAARWSGHKDPGLFVDALELLTPAERGMLAIDWVGEGELLEAARLRCAMIKDLGRIRFHGTVSKKVIAGLLAGANALVHPTKAENAPCIIMESLCCGTPVISNAVNGVPEMVDAHKGMLCPPSDASALAGALRSLIHDPGRFDRERIAREAHQRYGMRAVGEMLLAAHAQATGCR